MFLEQGSGDGGGQLQRNACKNCVFQQQQAPRGGSAAGAFGAGFVRPMLSALPPPPSPLTHGPFPPYFCTGNPATCPCPNCSELRMRQGPPITARGVGDLPHHFVPRLSPTQALPPPPRMLSPHLQEGPLPFFPSSPPHMGKPSQQNCPMHDELSLSCYCVTCKMPICIGCWHSYHHYHTVHSGQSLPQLARVTMAVARTELKLSTQSIEATSEMEDRIARARERVTNDIRQVFRTQYDALRKKEAELLAQVNAVCDLRVDSLSAQVGKMKEHVSNVQTRYRQALDAHPGAEQSSAAVVNLSDELYLATPTTNKSPFAVLEDDSFHLRKSTSHMLEAIQSLCQLSTSAYPPLCVPSGEGLSQPRCNQVCTVSISTKDRTGAPCLEGGEPLFVELKGPDEGIIPANIHDHQDGTYSFTYKPLSAGRHSLTIAIRKQHIQGSPFIVHVEESHEYHYLGRVTQVFGSEGGEPGQFNRPWGITTDHHGNIIIGDRSNHRIQVFDSNGKYKHSFGTEGVRPGQFNRPAGVAVTREGNIVVADKDNHRIQVLKVNGHFLFMFGSKGSNDGQMIYPYDVSVNELDGRIAVTDTGNHRLLVFSAEGILLGKFGHKGYLCGHFDSPRGIAFNGNGSLVVSDFNVHHILVIYPDGTTAKILGSHGSGNGQFTRPQGISIDHMGNYIIADTRNHRIVIMQPNGQVVTKFGGPGSAPGLFDRPTSVAVLPDGRIVAVDFGNSRIQIF